MTDDKDDLKEILDPNKWENTYAALNDNDELIAFGLKPELTGKGLGEKFVIKGINYGIKKYKYRSNPLIMEKKYVELHFS